MAEPLDSVTVGGRRPRVSNRGTASPGGTRQAASDRTRPVGTKRTRPAALPSSGAVPPTREVRGETEADGAGGTGLDWRIVRERLRERGLRWTPQRRRLLEVLADVRGHVTGAELVERCRRLDPDTIPSTIYRTLDVLEELGLVRHAHGLDGREEFHVLPRADHGHLYCEGCGRSWEIEAREAEPLVAAVAERHGFLVDLSHLAIAGRCAECRASKGDRQGR